MFHCHNLIHEDNDMMAAFNVTVLSDYGYNATSLIDPMQPVFRAKSYTASDLTGRSGPFSNGEITKKMQLLANYQPYADQ
jgi:hypothetical protein